MNDLELVGYYVGPDAYCPTCSPTNDHLHGIYWADDPGSEPMFCADCGAPLVPATEEEPPEERPRKDDPPDNVKDLDLDDPFLRPNR